jgi:hypothetical protein
MKFNELQETFIFLNEIWGCHGGEDVDVGLSDCDGVWTCR